MRPPDDVLGEAQVEAHEDALAGASPELLLSVLLRSGVLLSLALMAAGVVLMLVHHPDYLSSADAFERVRRDAFVPHTLSEVLAGLAGARGRALTMVGLLVLIALPVVRVALSLAIFHRLRDRTFVRITAAVLGMLLLALLMGHAEGG